jgi:predicted metal-dependent hydrolase
MSTSSAYLTVGGIGIDVIYKDIKNLHISVHPPAGRVRVAAPNRLDDQAIRLAVIQRLPWIKRQREQLQSAPRQTKRNMVSGESHYVWGQRYLLDVSRTGRHGVELAGKTLWVVAPNGSDDDARLRVLENWYRRELKRAIPSLIAEWEPVIGRQVESWTVRRMKTKWGSCSADSAHLRFNVELAKKDPRCLEYIVVHEMAHLRERGHGERFVSLMDQYLPNWRALRAELNAAPLADEEWTEAEGGA